MSRGGDEAEAERGFFRLAGAAGLLFAVLWVAAAVVADLPPVDSQAAEIADYFDAEHVGVVTSVYLQGVGLACFLVFVAGLAVWLRRAGEQWLGATLLAAGVTLTALLGQAAIVLGALAYRATDDASVAQSVFDLTLLGYTFSSFPLAALVAAAGLAALRSGVFPRWYGWAALVAAAVFVVAAATYAGSGFFAPGGGYSRAASVVFLGWALATSGLLFRVLPVHRVGDTLGPRRRNTDERRERVATLYERLGGIEAITSVVDAFVARCAGDGRINRKFERSDIPRLKTMLIDQVCEATGGPCSYTGRDMQETHAGMGVTAGEFDALVEDLVATLGEFDVPQAEQEELLGLLAPIREDVVEVESPETGTPLPDAYQPAPALR
jgi:hemoglobin